MRRSTVAVMMSTLLLAAIQPLGAWDRTGHEVIARIAWEYMTPAARERAVAALLGAPPGSGLADLLPDDADPETAARTLFQRSAYWPDLVRASDHPGHRFDRGTWHFVNIFWTDEDGRVVELDDRPEVGEAVNRLEYYRCILPHSAAEDLGVHIAWLLHIAGDLHQPLHASARVTALEPRGDRGGNDFALDGTHNLHGYWDRILTSTFERGAGETFESFVDRLAEWLVAEHPPESLANELRERQPRAWARASFELASTMVYSPGLERGQAPPESYAAHALAVAAPRLALAGYRLADWLNEALDAGPR